MGNESSAHQTDNYVSNADSRNELGNSLQPVAGDYLPPMVLVVEALLWSPQRSFANCEELFYIASLDGREVGRATRYPSTPVRVAPCTHSSVVTLSFYAGTDAAGFAAKTTFDVRRIGEITLPVSRMMKYGAPLYTSMWLGLSSELSSMTVDVNDALVKARSPEVPKALITLLKPNHERYQNGAMQQITPRQISPLRQGPQPDTTAFADTENQGLDLCFGPTAKNGKVSTEQQVQGLVNALKAANQTARAWQNAIFAPSGLCLSGSGKLQNLEADRDGVKDKDAVSVASAESRSIRADLEIKLASAAVEIERLRTVEARQQQMKVQLEHARSELQGLLSTDHNHQEELQKSLVDAQKRELALMNENAGLQKFCADVKSEYAKLTQKFEEATKESFHLRGENVAMKDGNTRLSQMHQEHEALKVAYRSLRNDYDDLLKREIETSCGMREEDLRERFIALNVQVDAMKIEKDTSIRHLQARVRELENENQDVLQKGLRRDAESVPIAIHRALQERLDQTANERDSMVERFLKEQAQSAEERISLLAQAEQEQLRLSQQLAQAIQERNVCSSQQQTLKTQLAQVTEERDSLQARAQQQQQALSSQLSQSAEERSSFLVQVEQEQQLLNKQLAQVAEERAILLSNAEILQAKLAQAEEDRDGLKAQTERDQQVLKAKLAQVDGILEARLKEQSESLPQRQISHSVPMQEYETLQMKFKESEQAREVLQAQLDRAVVGRFSGKSSPTGRLSPRGVTTPPDQAGLRSHPGVSIEEFQALQDQLTQIETQRQNFMELVESAQQAASTTGVSIEEYEALQRKIEVLEAVASRAPQATVPLQDYEALQARLEHVESTSQGSMELARSQEQLRLERDALSNELLQLRGQQDHTAIERAVASAVARESEHFQLREAAMSRDMEALQHELSDVLKHLDEVKQENRILDASVNMGRRNSDPDMDGAERLPRQRRSLTPRSSRNSTNMTKAVSEEVIRREGEKTMMGAKVSEMRLAMKKKDAAHKEDIAKLNRELMLLRSMSNGEKQRVSELELQVEMLAKEADSYKEVIQSEQAQLEEFASDGQESKIELAKLRGEIEVLREREKEWLSMGPVGSNEARPEVPSTGDRIDMPKGNSASSSKNDSYIMRLFHRLLWEKFSHFDPDEIGKHLKLEQRQNNLPRADVEKVLKMYKNHQKNFTIAKAFRSIDVHRTGRLAAHEFELRLTQMLALDVELSGYIYRLLQNCLYPPSEVGSTNDSPASSSFGGSTEIPVAVGRGPGSASRPLDSSKSIEERMITEEQFAHVLESRRYTL